MDFYGTGKSNIINSPPVTSNFFPPCSPCAPSMKIPSTFFGYGIIPKPNPKDYGISDQSHLKNVYGKATPLYSPPVQYNALCPLPYIPEMCKKCHKPKKIKSYKSDIIPNKKKLKLSQ